MNNDQRSNVINLIDVIQSIDLQKILVTAFPDNEKIEEVMIGNLTSVKFLASIKRMLIQLRAELIEDTGLFLPYTYNYNNEYGHGNVYDDLQNLKNHLESNNPNGSLGFLNRLIYYQISNGFYDKSSHNLHNIDGLKINEMNERLKLCSESFNQQLHSSKTLLDQLKGKQQELVDFKNQKNNEFQQISNNLATANQNTNSINDLLNQSTAVHERINSIYQQQTDMLNNIKALRDTQKIESDKYISLLGQCNTTMNDQITKFSEQIKTHEEHLSFVEGKRSFFEERNQYLNNLIGREVGASLFETFKQRKVELESTVSFWKYAVPVMTVLTVIWIFAVFSSLFGMYGDNSKNLDWIHFSLNSLKVLPMLLLLLFAANQYVKERNFQEEYAFKSAVALTIKAYVDLLGEDNNKDKLIIDSVTGVYNSPITNTDKGKKDDVNNLMNSVKTLIESIKNITSRNT